MKIVANFYAKLMNIKGQYFVMLRATSSKDNDLVKKLFAAKTEREKRRGSESLLTCTLDLPYRMKSEKQLASVFSLVTAIFESMEGGKPTEEEKNDLYNDLLEMYAYRKPSRLQPNVRRVVRLSASNTFEASYFIEGLLIHLCMECQLTQDVQADVRTVLWNWERWKGQQELDANDYYDKEKTKPLSEKDYRKRHPYCAATGIRETLALHHIVTRGSNARAIHEVWNWVILSHEMHSY